MPIYKRGDKAGLTRWHYTTGQKFIEIVADGILKPATVLVLPGERPIVWFSTNQEWEPTANKGFRSDDGRVVPSPRQRPKNTVVGWSASESRQKRRPTIGRR